MFRLLCSGKMMKSLNGSTLKTNVRCFGDDPPRMERTINSIQILGRVGVEPQQRGTEQHPVVTFTVATHTNFKNENNDWTQRVDWHKVVVFKPTLRETAKNYLTKGQRVLINGKISYGEIKDRDGALRPSTSIIAEDLVFLQ